MKGTASRLFIAAALCATACETTYGIAREVALSAVPDPDCIRTVLRSVPDIRTVEETDLPMGDGTGTDVKPRIHTFRYEGEHFWANLTVDVQAARQIRLTQYRLTVNRKPSREEIRTTLAIMRAVEQRLARQCGIGELGGEVEQYCKAIECPE